MSVFKQLLGDIATTVEEHYGLQSYHQDKAREALIAKLEPLLNNRLSFQQAAETKYVSILLADIRGFTAISENYSARVVMAMLNRYFAMMTDVVLRYGGTIDKFMGDSIMVLFGAPVEQSDDAERAIACAVHMQQAMTEFNEQNRQLDLPDIYIGIGINSGEVMAGELGSELHKEYTVIGDEVNLVSRIEAQSLRGQILLSQNTYNIARDFVQTSEPNEVQVKGKQVPVRLYELLSTERPEMQVPRREVRKSPRVEVHNMPLAFQLLDGKTVQEQIHTGEVIDLGYYGMLAQVPFALVPGTEIQIMLAIQLLDMQTTHMYARVIEVKEVANGFHASMEFTFVDSLGQHGIKRYVDGLVFQS